ncbi:DinB family protein [Paenibacillus barcinonensis]|uniref:DinB family protein n=1 Tax=Paenibacillus barcinonensis TaxID=198119 RepID=A0A2V4WDV6_PAEBA|nr:DinB family protein [Paenibacillus barcinonensis]PYE49663.1 DinB family protein [Paenibacillus barcinonensis]QKS56631.1 DinB family protein [Paenibacillus barcinonensis]
MRNTSEVLQSFESSVERYVAELNALNIEDLLRKENDEEWSIGQMYMHLIQSALFMHLPNSEHCLANNENTVHADAEKTELGKTLFEAGQFPPIRVKVPASPQYTPLPPESKAQLVEGLQQVVERMRRVASILEEVPVSTSRKVSHPRFGALDAKEWFVLIDMHYRHHFLQLDRLKLNLEK